MIFVGKNYEFVVKDILIKRRAKDEFKIVNNLFGYLEILYNIKQELIKLYGEDVINNFKIAQK